MNRTELIFKRPYKESVLRWRKGPGGKELVYITARDVMDSLIKSVHYITGCWHRGMVKPFA